MSIQSPKRVHERGFTLPELLVSMAIFGLVCTGLFKIFNVHNRMAAVQEETTAMQQELLAAMSQMSNELRMCGFSGSPDRQGQRILRADPTAFSCTRRIAPSDDPASPDITNATLNFEGQTLQPRTKIIAYRQDAASNKLQKYFVRAGAVPWNPAAENIADLQFQYFDEDSNPTADLDSIRIIEITVTATASNARQGLNIGNRTMTTRVECRNLR